MEKAERYTDKAIVQISKLRSQADAPILSTFHVMLIEHMIQCRLVMGNKTKAVTELGLLTKLLSSSNCLLLGHHRAQLHTLLGKLDDITTFYWSLDINDLLRTVRHVHELYGGGRVSVQLRAADEQGARAVDFRQPQPGHRVPAPAAGPGEL